IRIEVSSSSSCPDSSVTRKPLLRTASTRPSLARSSIASRTGVADTPNFSASIGAEYTTPGRSCPLTIAARSACATCCRRLVRCPKAGSWTALVASSDVIVTGPSSQYETGPELVVAGQHELVLAGAVRRPLDPAYDRGAPVHGCRLLHAGVEPGADHRVVDQALLDADATCCVQ